jgi:ABC transport system ATP-binding/permease protein
MMNLWIGEQISKSYGMKMLLDQVDFSIGDGERVGLIGVNGTGKSSFLKIIAGIEPADSGRISMRNGIRIEYLPQNPPVDDESTVLQYIYGGSSPIMQLLRDYETALQQLEQNGGDPASQRRLLELQARMDAEGAWQLESDAKKVLFQLGITDIFARMGTLSGGQRKRVAMAAALLQPADLLILDEPTNHIDAETVQWLEQYLSRSSCALLMITHDRYFLDRVANRIIELDQGKLYSYTGNYSIFLEQKAERMEQLEASEQKRQNLLRKELAWIRRGAKARTTKQKARIERFEKLQDADGPVKAEKLDIALASSRLGKKVIEMNRIGISFEDRTLIRDFSYIVQRDDRIGIVGPNGAGKSTLLKLITGQLIPDSGTIDIGSTVKIGYFSQEQTEMDPKLRAINYIKEGAEQIRTTDGSVISASQMLERFLFPPAAQWTQIANLSGGEKRRLYLLRILIEAPNVLLLDEPTNDLDIQTLTVLEDYLDDFGGAVIVVSHDRYFLDRTVDTLLIMEGNGQVAHHVGNYSEYRDWLKTQTVNSTAEPSEAASKPSSSQAPSEDSSKKRGLKFSFKEQKEYEEIDDRIASVEAELETVNQAINDAGSDYVKLEELTGKQKELQQALDVLIERWTYLNELAEQIEAEKSGKR